LKRSSKALRAESGRRPTVGEADEAGAEGAVWLYLRGDADQVRRARELTESVQGEPPFIS
jgi:hypothetical protein